jgi:hypothetical protein
VRRLISGNVAVAMNFADISLPGMMNEIQFAKAACML